MKRKKLLSLILIGMVVILATLYFYTLFFQDERRLTPSMAAENSSLVSTYFPYGVFDDALVTNSATRFEAVLNDLKAHNLDSIIFANQSAIRHNNLLDISDRLNMNVIFGPHFEMYKQWWNSTTSATLDNAKQVATPIVGLLQSHPSLKGYTIVDDTPLGWKDKVILAFQAFKEVDPNHLTLGYAPSSVFQPEIYSKGRPSVYSTYYYPAGIGQEPCNFYRFENKTKDYVDMIRESTQFKPADMPLWLTLQTHTTETGNNDPVTALRYPTREEVRLQNWLSLGEGATGIFYFIYSTEQLWTGLEQNRLGLFDEVGSLAARVKSLKPILLNATKIQDKFSVLAPGRTYISTLKNKTADVYYVIAANHSCAPQNLTINSVYFSGKLKDLETNQVYPLGTTLPMNGGDGKMFELIEAKALTPIVSAPYPNLLQNASFEENANGYPAKWQLQTTGVWDNTMEHSGVASLQMRGPTAGSYSFQKVALKPNTRYTLSMWTKSSSGSVDSGVGMRYVQLANSSLIYAQMNRKEPFEWTRTYKIFTTPADYTDGRVDITWALKEGEVAWIDDVTLCEGRIECDGPGVALIGTPTPTAMPTSTPTPNPLINYNLKNNVLLNSSFEVNANGTPANWGARPSMQRDATVAHTGQASAKVTGPASFIYSIQNVSLLPRTKYMMLAWVKTQSVSGKGVSLRYAQLDPVTKNVPPNTPWVNGTTDWAPVYTTFTTADDSKTGRIDLYWSLNSGDIAWIDDVVLVENNLLSNASFETLANNYPSDWWVRAQAVSTSGATMVHRGQRALRLNSGVRNQNLFQSQDLQPNTRYVVSAWVKTQNIIGRGVSIRYPYVTGASGIPVQTAWINGSSDWVPLTGSFTTSSTASLSGRFDIFWDVSNADGYAIIDDVKICATTSGDCAGKSSPIGFSGVPAIPIDYSADVETFWANHPYNPQSVNYNPVINSPLPQVNVKTQFAGDINSAVKALPASGGTLFFPAGTYGSFEIVGRSNIHFISDGDAVLKGGQIFGCKESQVGYTAFDRCVSTASDPNHAACLKCLNNPVSNFYFKNIKFDGNNQAPIYNDGTIRGSGLFFGTVKDVVIDSATFENYIKVPTPSPQYHPGVISGNRHTENIWCRNCHFAGKALYHFFLDGSHGSGVMNSQFDFTGGTAGLLFLANDDMTEDINKNGVFEPSEQRNAKFNIVYNNLFHGTTSMIMSVMGEKTLVKNNVDDNFSGTFAQFQGRCSNTQAHKGNVYSHYGNKVIGNRTQNHTDFVVFEGHLATTCAPLTPPPSQYGKVGQYVVKDNQIQNTNFVFKNLIRQTQPIDGPNVVENNYVNGKLVLTPAP